MPWGVGAKGKGGGGWGWGRGGWRGRLLSLQKTRTQQPADSKQRLIQRRCDFPGVQQAVVEQVHAEVLIDHLLSKQVTGKPSPQKQQQLLMPMQLSWTAAEMEVEKRETAEPASPEHSAASECRQWSWLATPAVQQADADQVYRGELNDHLLTHSAGQALAWDAAAAAAAADAAEPDCSSVRACLPEASIKDQGSSQQPCSSVSQTCCMCRAALYAAQYELLGSSAAGIKDRHLAGATKRT